MTRERGCIRRGNIFWTKPNPPIKAIRQIKGYSSLFPQAKKLEHGTKESGVTLEPREGR